MRDDLEDLYEGPRYEKRAKRRRINKIFNVVTIVAVFLTIFFAMKLLVFNGNSSELANSNVDQTSQQKDTSSPSSNEGSKNTGESNENNGEMTDGQASDDGENQSTNDSSSGDRVVSVGDPESNVLNVIVDPSWKPIGTEQSEPHVAVYDDQSIDWTEMIKAASYGTGLSQTEMILWWIENNGSPQKAAVTVTSKDQQQIYRVYIEWIEKEGWMPTKIEQLKENDKHPSYEDDSEQQLDETASNNE